MRAKEIFFDYNTNALMKHPVFPMQKEGERSVYHETGERYPEGTWNHQKDSGRILRFSAETAWTYRDRCSQLSQFCSCPCRRWRGHHPLFADIILRYRKDDGNPLSSEGNHHLLCFRQFLLHVSAAGSRDMQ